MNSRLTPQSRIRCLRCLQSFAYGVKLLLTLQAIFICACQCAFVIFRCRFECLLVLLTNSRSGDGSFQVSLLNLFVFAF